MTRWQFVPVEPDAAMTRAFAAEIRRQAERLDKNSTAHEPLAPLWTAVLAAAPTMVGPAPAAMTRAEIVAHNTGVLSVVALAKASAAALRLKLREKPTRYSYAIEAFDGIAEIGVELVLPLPPEAPEPATAALPKPVPPSGGVVQEELHERERHRSRSRTSDVREGAEA